MDVKKVNKLGKELDNFMRLKTRSLGIKFYKKASEVPKEFKRFSKSQAVCVVFGWSRYLEIPVVLSSDKYIPCTAATVSLGWGKLPENIGEMVVGAYAKTKENALKVLENMLSLDGKFEAFAVCPLDRITVEPDLVQIWGNPYQMLMIEQASSWNGWPRIKLAGNGHGASCYEALTVPYITREIRFSIADAGDRRDGMAQDCEMIMGMPFDKLELLIEGLNDVQNTMSRFPLIYDFGKPFPIREDAIRMKFPDYRSGKFWVKQKLDT